MSSILTSPTKNLVEEYAAVKFTLTKEQDAKVQQWLHETVYPYVIAKQKAYYEQSFCQKLLGRPRRYPNPIERDCWEMGYPYSGASGGGLTYEFTPTSIGTVEIVRYSGYPESLDLTDYLSW